MSAISRKQQTLKRSASYSGIGLHSGDPVTLTFHPAEEYHGIVFRRVDLPGQPLIAAHVHNVRDTSRNTTLTTPEASIQTVEHVLAALRAYDIDNCLIHVNAGEPPAGNGSSDVFVEMIETAGVSP